MISNRVFVQIFRLLVVDAIDLDVATEMGMELDYGGGLECGGPFISVYCHRQTHVQPMIGSS